MGSVNVTAVPEPESYAMLLAGLAIVGAVARRRRAFTHA
ncbi:MAG: FxDxF family PEP-CTERM protein [Azoarcus sp.]|nr:FxDxF family PEP-CTERM protein [Azoarcus sp.]